MAAGTAAWVAASRVAAVDTQGEAEAIRAGADAGGSNEPQVDGKKIMEKIATQTGGRYFEAKKKDNLEEIYGQIAEELRGQYLLTYTPDKVDTDGGYHKVALKANKDDLTC
jgi:VWFA-related protein